MTEVKIPKSWDEVTISQWQEIALIESDNDASLFIEQLSILADIDSQVIRDMSLREYASVKEQTIFLSQPLSTEVTTKFELDGVRYGIIPQMDFIKYGEFADAENWKNKSVENMHLYAALIFRPITKETDLYYEIEPHRAEGFVERSNLFRDKLPITTIYASVLFFSTAAIGYTENLVAYLQSQLTPTKKATSKRKTTPKATKTNRKRNSK